MNTDILAIIMAWWITFTLVVTVVLSLGFGPVGVGYGNYLALPEIIIGLTGFALGTLAAGFQSWAYGGFTPPAGLFATLTSLAMTSALGPPVALAAATVATLVAGVVWACGVGR